MNIYKSLNQLIQYIEENIEENLDLQKMAKIVGVNSHALQSLFSILTNVNLSEYIRLRRLSLSIVDLQNGSNITEVAIKYQYNSPVAFSRAFTNYFGVKPRDVKKKKCSLKGYPIFHFKEENALALSYRIEEKINFSLYGVKKTTNEKRIANDAPNFFKEITKKYKKKCGDVCYAMVKYEHRFESSNLEYWCLYKEPFRDFLKVDFPKSKWLIFTLNSRNPRDIQNLSYEFYMHFFPKNKYELRDLPELEVYLENDKMEFWVPIL